MFKNIQKYLLLHHPLLWNTKFVPMLIIGVTFNILSFFFGFLNGKIDFSNKESMGLDFIFTTIGILIVIIAIILWLVRYLQNNAFKSFYHKSEYSLFYEWLQIFTILFLLISFSISFQTGTRLRERSYYSKEEATKRCEIISKADVFIDASFGPTEPSKNRYKALGDTATTDNYILFEGKKYDEFSLLNRRVFEFSLISSEKNLANRVSIQKDLIHDDKISIRSLMTDYLKIIKEHKLMTNLTTETWFNTVYKNYPTFVNFTNIKPYFEEEEKYYNYSINNYDYNQYENNIDKYSSFYVQQDILKYNYDKISVAFTDDLINYDLLLVFLYIALGLSLSIFSFKVTSGKNWLISLVSLGVLNIIFGIVSVLVATIDYRNFIYPYLCLTTILAIIIYFFRTYFQSKDKGKSSIALNLFLWTFATIIPIIYFLIMIRYKSDYIERDNDETYYWFENNIANMFAINFIVSIIILFFLSNVIRKWKGIAEE